MNELKRGFIAPIITEDNHILGSSGIPLPVINPSGDWTAYLPKFESQLDNQGFDPDDCTVAGTLYAVSALEKFLYQTDNTHSRRFVYNGAEMKPPGDDPHRIATFIRGLGLILETDLLDDVDSLEEFMTPRPLTVDLRVKGQSWLNKQMLGHQFLWTTPPDQATRLALIKEALTKGPVCVSVTAWFENEKGLYYSPMGMQNEHWVHIYKIDDTGIYAFDSYIDARPEVNSNLKKLTLDHNIQFAKVYFFTTPTVKQVWYMQIINSLLEILNLKQKELQQVVLPSKPMTNKIQQWASIIADLEGAKPELNNPGNFKYSPLLASWGGVKANAGSDGGYFCKFPTYAMGFQALVNFLTLGCHDELKAYHSARTIKEFTLVYTNHPKPQFDYSDTLIKRLGVTPETDISTFL